MDSTEKVLKMQEICNTPGMSIFSTVNSIQEETAAKVYSMLWFNKKESRDKLRGLMIAVTRYSE